jgi:hypothetical protein
MPGCLGAHAAASCAFSCRVSEVKANVAVPVDILDNMLVVAGARPVAHAHLHLTMCPTCLTGFATGRCQYQSRRTPRRVPNDPILFDYRSASAAAYADRRPSHRTSIPRPRYIRPPAAATGRGVPGSAAGRSARDRASSSSGVIHPLRWAGGRLLARIVLGHRRLRCHQGSGSWGHEEGELARIRTDRGRWV